MQSSGDSLSPIGPPAVPASDSADSFLRETDGGKGTSPGGPKPRSGRRGRRAQAKGKRPAGDGPKKADLKEAFTIDFEGLDQRILSFPASQVPPGNYRSLQAGAAGQVFYLSVPESSGERRGPPPGGAVFRYDLEKRKADPVQQNVTQYELTPDGRHLLLAHPPSKPDGDPTWAIAAVPVGGGLGASMGAAALMAGKGPGAAIAIQDAQPGRRSS